MATELEIPKCKKCGRALLDMGVDHEDTGYICRCGYLHFPSDFLMCETGYTRISLWQ